MIFATKPNPKSFCMKPIVYTLFLTLLAGCATESPSESTAPESAEPAAAATETSEPDTSESTSAAEPDATNEVIVVDVRSKEEWDSGHVETAIHIPHTEIADRIAEISDNKDAKIVTYCAVGGRAGKAKEALEALGFTNVENGGGYDDVKDRF